MLNSQDILKFWFEALTPSDWYAKNDDLDEEITTRFADIHHCASQGELWHWRDTAESALAEVIILDQFSRNMFRYDARAFAYDGMVLLLSQYAVSKDWHEQLEPMKKAFLLMPYMHSESAKVHEEAVKLFDVPGLEHNLEFEFRHKEIIDRFGRYPHRNVVLGRESTIEEQAFLLQDGSSF